MADVGVVLVALALLGGLGWYFFGPRPAHVALLDDGVQRVEVTVRGGY
jgi:Cu+-exporting ATPase